jgi:seryl-tRNA synthetase
MLELRFIRENIDLVREKTIRRGMEPAIIDRFSEIDAGRLALLAEAENLKNRRNTVSRRIAELKQSGANDTAEPLIREMREVSARIREMDARLSSIEEELRDIVMSIPNLCDDSVPVGKVTVTTLKSEGGAGYPRFPFSRGPIGKSASSLIFSTSRPRPGSPAPGSRS